MTYPYLTVGDESWYLTPKGTTTNIALSTPAWNVTTFGGSPRALPPLRGDNQIIPYRPGRESRTKVADSRTISFMMWVTGADPANEYLLSSDQELAFNDNFNILRKVVWQSRYSSMTLTRRWRLGASIGLQGRGTYNSETQYVVDDAVMFQDRWYRVKDEPLPGTAPTDLSTDPYWALATKVAEADVQVDDIMEPTMTGRTRCTFSMDLFLANPYFWGGSTTHTVPGTVNNPGDDIAEYKGMYITLPSGGTLSNGSVSLTVSGGGTLDCENFTTTGGLPLSGISHNGSKSWFALFPGDNNVTWSGGAGASITFRAPYV